MTYNNTVYEYNILLVCYISCYKITYKAPTCIHDGMQNTHFFLSYTKGHNYDI